MGFKQFVDGLDHVNIIWEGDYEGHTYVLVEEEVMLVEAGADIPGLADFFKDFSDVNKSNVTRFMSKAKMNAKMASTNRSPSGFITGLAAGAKKLMSNPLAAASLASIAVTAYKQYQKNQRATTTFYAKDPYERNFYQKMVDDMKKTGQYSMLKHRVKDGVHIWVLRKK